MKTNGTTILRTLAAATAIAATFVSASCDRGEGHTTDKLIDAEASEPRLAAAAVEAREKWNDFVTEFRKAEVGVEHLVKAPFTAINGNVEHMWVAVTAVDADVITGVLASDPYAKFSVKQGDKVTVKLPEIEDWVVRKPDGSMLGGFCIPVLEQIEMERAGK